MKCANGECDCSGICNGNPTATTDFLDEIERRYPLMLSQDDLFNLTSIVGDASGRYGIYGRLLKIIDDNKLGVAFHDFDDAYLAEKAARNA